MIDPLVFFAQLCIIIIIIIVFIIEKDEETRIGSEMEEESHVDKGTAGRKEA